MDLMLCLDNKAFNMPESSRDRSKAPLRARKAFHAFRSDKQITVAVGYILRVPSMPPIASAALVTFLELLLVVTKPLFAYVFAATSTVRMKVFVLQGGVEAVESSKASNPSQESRKVNLKVGKYVLNEHGNAHVAQLGDEQSVRLQAWNGVGGPTLAATKKVKPPHRAKQREHPSPPRSCGSAFVHVELSLHTSWV